ncbi:hypothetical protein ABZ793_28875 [Micromonospora sp. NPDC047465]|uniref:hypothetical protein n=1 Tax=Micromonospora sp. NPDC047465 TaxID=3154813 RepID=UPI00340A0897
MTTDASFPDLIADRARVALRGMIAGMTDPPSAATLDHLVQRSVHMAFGCTCPQQTNDGTGLSQKACPLHGQTQRVRSHDEAVMPSQATSWEDDPYYDLTNAERREDVQARLRAAAEFSRTFRSELAATVRRGYMAQEQLENAIEHASFSGGLTHSELEMAEMALSAVQYALRQLYAAGNHVGDQPGADRHR